jgi:hypothetical protein
MDAREAVSALADWLRFVWRAVFFACCDALGHRWGRWSSWQYQPNYDGCSARARVCKRCGCSMFELDDSRVSRKEASQS